MTIEKEVCRKRKADKVNHVYYILGGQCKCMLFTLDTPQGTPAHMTGTGIWLALAQTNNSPKIVTFFNF